MRFAYRCQRNLTSYTYDEGVAREVKSTIQFLEDARQLLTAVQKMSDSIELRASELEWVLKIIANTIPDLEVWAFSSRVHCRQLKAFSDLHLVVFTLKSQLLGLGVLSEKSS